MGSLEPSLPLHAVILPFMAKGHTLPLLHLAGVLLGRQPPLSSPKHCKTLTPLRMQWLLFVCKHKMALQGDPN
ncbi:hypothetical protein JHK85_001196 [Glycine max]|uniref:Uncharacterized protein n=1 Tax=Glycine max TaxID=3847 RepID=K7K2X5_SOYBN|nr:hypothetical protein JHK85_001196 [Glycine max]KAG5088553.1 hypothetical protein JHK86_001165 [Glycine max]KAH1162431.1 hypothetical protein GYH30_001072 [Glycine max]